MIRVLIADDHAVVREGLGAIIKGQEDMGVAGEAGDGREAVVLFRKLCPDVTLMDLSMPVMNGIEAIAAIRRESPHARFIVLTIYEGDVDVYRALQVGAQAYLLKGVSSAEIARTIRCVHTGSYRLAPEVAARLAEHVASRELTEREIATVRLIARGLGNREIAKSLGVTTGTVRAHVTNIMRKLEAASRTEAACLAARKGYLHIGEDGGR